MPALQGDPPRAVLFDYGNTLVEYTAREVAQVDDALAEVLARRFGRVDRAALAGMSLTDYLLAEIRHVAERPTAAEIFERLRSRPTVTPEIPVADMVREERDTR